MRCQCCNRVLSDWEATLRQASTGEFLDTCNKCLKGLDISYIGREDLDPYEQIFEEGDGYEEFLKDLDEVDSE